MGGCKRKGGVKCNFQMNESELEAFVKISDENGEISKNDIIIQVNIAYYEMLILEYAHLSVTNIPHGYHSVSHYPTDYIIFQPLLYGSHRLSARRVKTYEAQSASS